MLSKCIFQIKALPLVLSVGIMTFGTAAIANTNYSAVNDFPNVAVTPTSGQWSYGSNAGLNPANFSLLTTATNNYFGSPTGAVGFYTQTTGSYGTYKLPVVLKNTTGSDMSNIPDAPNLGPWSPSFLLLHPGPAGDNAVIRFTAPTTATYIVTGLFKALDINTTTDKIIVSGNAVPVFSALSVPTANFNFSQVLTAGQTIDFSVGFGGPLPGLLNDFYYDSTGFSANIEATPEPSFYAVLALGLGGLAFARRRVA